jgi:predicted  nucleic acid-binding Zn-ribbon protein
MNKIMSFISSYEEELILQIEFIDKSITRLKKQIKESENSIKKAKASIDESYSVFSASQSNNEVDTEIITHTQIIEDKKKQIEDLSNRKNEISVRLEEIKAIKEPESEQEYMDDIVDKLILIKKLIGVDNHRAKTEMDILISKIKGTEE